MDLASIDSSMALHLPSYVLKDLQWHFSDIFLETIYEKGILQKLENPKAKKILDEEDARSYVLSIIK